MKDPNELITCYSDFGNEISMTREQAEYASHPGNCDQEIAELRNKIDTSLLDTASLRKELAEYGAWDDDQLADHEENVLRWIWICAGNIADGLYDEESF